VKTELKISKAELARKLGVSRTYVTLLTQGRRRPSQQLVIKLTELMLMHDMPLGLSDVQVGKRGLEPRRLSAHDPKLLESECALPTTDAKTLLADFIFSRRQGLSPNTIAYYKTCLRPFVNKYELTADGINQFLSSLTCSAGAKACYFKAIRAFINWLVKIEYLHSNPMRKVDPPKPKKMVLPSLTNEQVDYLIDCVDNPRDKAIISLFADSGMRVSELASVRAQDINWDDNTVLIWGKGGKQRRAPFTKRTAELLAEHMKVKRVSQVSRKVYNNVWNMRHRAIQDMLLELSRATGLPCNPHTFRRTFASNLHRAGLDIEHIMRLGGWESLDMVLTYTKSVKFEDSLKIYHNMQSH